LTKKLGVLHEGKCKERALELLASSKHRYKFTSKLDHHGRNYFIPDYIRPIEPRHHSPKHSGHTSSESAPQTCRVIGDARQDVCGEVPHDGGADALYASPEML